MEKDVFVITDPEAVKKLLEIIESDEPVKPISTTPYTSKDRERALYLIRKNIRKNRSDDYASETSAIQEIQ